MDIDNVIRGPHRLTHLNLSLLCWVGLTGWGVCWERALISRALHGPRAGRPPPLRGSSSPCLGAPGPLFPRHGRTDVHSRETRALQRLRCCFGGKTVTVREPGEVTDGLPEVYRVWTWTWSAAWAQLCLFKRGRDGSLSGSRSPAGRHVRGYSRMLWVCVYLHPHLFEKLK